ncbi:hypothetical protein GCM10010266_24050 [Streptomyces griseomycini]|nr:hypothetical protein GCM10010266_24050 [Streptomyces griseomycini]
MTGSRRAAAPLQHSPLLVLAPPGAWEAGAVVVPVDPMHESGEATHVLRDAGAAAPVRSGRARRAYPRDTAAGPPVRTLRTLERLPGAPDADGPTGTIRAGHEARGRGGPGVRGTRPGGPESPHRGERGRPDPRCGPPPHGAAPRSGRRRVPPRRPPTGP